MPWFIKVRMTLAPRGRPATCRNRTFKVDDSYGNLSLQEVLTELASETDGGRWRHCTLTLHGNWLLPDEMLGRKLRDLSCSLPISQLLDEAQQRSCLRMIQSTLPQLNDESQEVEGILHAFYDAKTGLPKDAKADGAPLYWERDYSGDRDDAKQRRLLHEYCERKGLYSKTTQRSGYRYFGCKTHNCPLVANCPRGVACHARCPQEEDGDCCGDWLDDVPTKRPVVLVFRPGTPVPSTHKEMNQLFGEVARVRALGGN